MPHRGAIAVAEHTLALALGLYRRLVPGHLQCATGAYRELGKEPVATDERTIAFNWMGLDGLRQLHGKTIGLVGLGDIGLEVARRARAFDMNVVYFRRQRVAAEHEARLRIRYSALDELLEQADIVSLHAPHTPATEGMIGPAALARMKPDALLINTSRGGLVDEAALAECLRDGRIGGAGLDVFRDEPLPQGHPLTGLDNVLLSPHVGGGTGGGQKGLVGDIVANIERVAAGRTAEHVVEVAGEGAWP
jgi:phosphoglycerate dehydrogenase-like enzyme